MTTIKPNQKSVLVLGATGRTGLECIKKLSDHPSKPEVHAFCRDESKLSDEDKRLCTSVVKGNAKSAPDIEGALRNTKADVVIVSLGNGDSVKKSDIRTVSAQVLASAMQNDEFEHVRVVVVSSAGAGSSQIIVGMGIGMLISYHLRHVLTDHSGQEMAFSTPELKPKIIVVRASGLADNKPKGKLVTYGDKEKAPTIETDRADLAAWVANEVCSATWNGGKTFNVTGAKM